MKDRLKKIIGQKAYKLIARIYRYLINTRLLFLNFYDDMKLYKEHSNVFKLNSLQKIEANIILDYHAIEKGFVHKKIRARFGQKKILQLIDNLQIIESKYKHTSQTIIAYKVLCDYYEYHLNNSITIDDYFSKEQYDFFKTKSLNEENKVYSVKSETDYFSDINKPFDQFSNSRKSIRSFSSELISVDKIKECINLAANSPSVCNRQSAKVYLVENKEKVKEMLDLQGGLVGFQDKISQILVVTVDRNFFYTIGERNQFYIDGGIYLMNLMYVLHFNKIACCPANWGKTYKTDRAARTVLNLKKSEKIVCVLAIGYLEGDVKYCLSKRRPVNEVLEIV